MSILDRDYKMKVTPEQSRALQEACFANGIVWNGGDSKTVVYTDKPYLYIRACGTITCGAEGEEAFFDNAKLCPVEPESFIAMLNNKPKGHPHAELMAQYAKDAAETKTPWERWEWCADGDDDWEPCHQSPVWAGNTKYRRKPDTIKVGKHEFPYPMRTAPEMGKRYWCVSLTFPGFYVENSVWEGDRTDENLLESNLCHLTKEAAEQHAGVLNAINRGDIE